MKAFVVKPIFSLKGSISLPGDKSIAHRSIIISSLCKGKTVIDNFPLNKDCLASISVFETLGIKINKFVDRVTVSAHGLCGLKKPSGPIFISESGTTLRLLLGVLAGQNFKSKLIAGNSLSKRPMLRVNAPLRLMGAKIIAKRLPVRQAGKTENAKIEEYVPIIIEGGDLKAIQYKMPIASAQVKSAILLAALFAKGKTRIIEPVLTRDHTERMLKLFKADVKVVRNNIVIEGDNELVSPAKITVPGDISSAAFFMVLAAIVPNSRLSIRNVSLNPTRAGAIQVLKRMNANINIVLSKSRLSRFEPAGNVTIKGSFLMATVVKKEEIPSLIDELPILMVAASFANGTSIFEGVDELRVKETDRINSMVTNLTAMGVNIKVVKSRGLENIIIKGPNEFKSAKIRSFGDHRTAMSMVVAGLGAGKKLSLDDISCVSKSFPDFLKVLKSVTR